MINIFFAARLAFKQLVYEKPKTFAAIIGVVFATILVFMQLGFRDSLFASAASAPKRLRADLFIVNKQTEAMWRSVPFDRRELMRSYAHSAVKEVISLYIGQARFKNPENFTSHTILVYATDPYANSFGRDDIDAYKYLLSQSDKIIFDVASRPDFGPIEKLLNNGKVFTEINDRAVEIVGTFRMGTSFAADGNLITSDSNFIRLFPSRDMSLIDVGLIRLDEKSDPNLVKEELTKLLDEGIHIFTYQEIMDFELNYWRNKTPIGFIFGFGMFMGLVVGMVIVYQILFTNITNHLSEYATLKAIGYSNKYLVLIVLAESIYLALAGFFPGFIISLFLYSFTENATFIPMPMGFAKAIKVFSLIIGMCFFSGMLAIKKLRDANPADMF